MRTNPYPLTASGTDMLPVKCPKCEQTLWVVGSDEVGLSVVCSSADHEFTLKHTVDLREIPDHVRTQLVEKKAKGER